MMFLRFILNIDVLLEINRMSFPGFHLDPSKVNFYNFGKKNNIFRNFFFKLRWATIWETEIDVKHESEQPVNPLMIFKIVQKVIINGRYR